LLPTNTFPAPAASAVRHFHRAPESMRPLRHKPSNQTPWTHVTIEYVPSILSEQEDRGQESEVKMKAPPNQQARASHSGVLPYVQHRQPEIIALIRRFVECESPSDDAAAIGRFLELVSDTVAPFAKVKRVAGNHLLCEMA